MRHLRLLVGTLVTVGLLVALGESTAYARHAFAPSGLGGAVATQEHYTDDLLAIKGVVGTAVGLNAAGQPVVKIFAETAEVPGLPRSLDGVPVVVQVTGKIYAIDRPVDGKHDHGGDNGEEVDPKSRFDRPVPIGVSSGTVESIEIIGIFITCSVGTLGARVKHGSAVYALSANHIYALENSASIGSTIVQPGPADTDPVCSDNGLTDSIGVLDDFVPIVFDGLDELPTDNEVDAAIALSSTVDLDNATPSDGYGLPKTATVAANLNAQVQKYGRTTSLTKGTITGINATIIVGYDSGPARFVGQIEVSGSKGPFIKGGDSGSLLVTDPDRNPVGLLFAGNRSGKIAFANQIDVVLDAFGVTFTIDGE